MSGTSHLQGVMVRSKATQFRRTMTNAWRTLGELQIAAKLEDAERTRAKAAAAADAQARRAIEAGRQPLAEVQQAVGYPGRHFRCLQYAEARRLGARPTQDPEIWVLPNGAHESFERTVGHARHLAKIAAQRREAGEDRAARRLRDTLRRHPARAEPAASAAHTKGA
ncbi:MAG TPA: hypothetical protein VGK67_26390 [Myxococcales bacterium]|jgi:hypothetical protein